MAAFDLDFDATQVDTTDNYELLPAGNYVAKIIGSEIADNKSGTGKILKLTWELCGGDYDGRKLWQDIEFLSDDSEKQKKGQTALALVCAAVGIQHLRSSEHLHHVECMIIVTVSKPKDGYTARNWVGKASPLEGGAAPQPQQQARQTTTRSAPPAAAQAQPRAASGGAPWRK